MSADFLRSAGWGDAVLAPLPGDASTRSYVRVTRGHETAMLMRQPQKAEAPVAAADASEDERRALGYNAIARLAGADCGRFAAVANYLRSRGLAAPQILAADFPQGLVLIEDFGDDLYADVLARDGGEEELYKAAVEVLARLHAEDAPRELPGGFALHAYDDVALVAETDLLTEWFLPLALGRPATAAEAAEHRRLWRTALNSIEGGRRVFVHRDYHAQNLFWMPQRDGLSRVGLIDFQDAVAGSPAYDLISLIEDARRDVTVEIAEAGTRHYLAAMGPGLDPDKFRHEIAVMAAQRNAKIVGIFARLYKRDGKARYLAFLPRVWAYLERDLAHPSLKELRAWYDWTIPQEVRGLPNLQKELA